MCRTQGVDQFLLEASPSGLADDDHPQINTFQQFAGLFHALLAESAHIVKTGGVNEQHRAERRQFKGFFDRVGRGSRLLGDNGYRLPGQCIDQRGFARIPASEDADVGAQAFWGGSHAKISPCC